jgi:hypothetical protein
MIIETIARKTAALVTEQPIDYPAWIGAVAAIIGVPLSLVSLYKLVQRDKDREQQIAKLASIAVVLESQTEAILSQNELFAQQVDIFRNTSLLKGADNEAIAKLQEIEEKRLRLSVQPRLWLNGAGYKGPEGTLQIDLNNKGEVAHLDQFELIEGDIQLQGENLPWDVEKGDRRYIFGKTKGEKHIKDCHYRIAIHYHDALGNKFQAIVDGLGAHARIISNEPTP